MNKSNLGMRFFLGLILLIFSQQVHAERLGIVKIGVAKCYGDLHGIKVLKLFKKGEPVSVGEMKVMDYYEVTSMENAFIKAEDIQIVEEDVNTKRLSLSYLQSTSTLTQDFDNGPIGKSETLNFRGIALNFALHRSQDWGLQYSLKYISSQPVEEESFEFVEIGFGGLYSIYENSRLRFQFEIEGNLIPLSYYTFAEEFRVHSFGASASAGLNLVVQLNKNWSIATQVHYNYLKFMKFRLPPPYRDTSPSVMGPRLGIGVEYSF